MESLSESQKFIYISRYARWLPDEQRRELSWDETVDRYLSFLKARFGGKIPNKLWRQSEKQLKSMGAMPSMRAAWSAGPALEANNILAYNCSYVPYQDLQALAEMFYILMCGTGVGFSVEKQYISQMPVVPIWHGDGAGIHVVEDSREGWASSLRAGLEAWFSGKDIEFDYSKVRPRGARLKTMGGRASGPDPLKKLHDFCRDLISKAQGRQLTSLEWQDIGNMIGEVVVVGGVRRASEIAFSDLDDNLIRYAKQPPFPPYRYMSNNSAIYTQKPSPIGFMKEWLALAESGTGERGFFNLVGVEKHLKGSRRKFDSHMRANPCSEILLKPFSFCNLTEVVVRGSDTFDDLIEKVKVAVWLGAMQATLTKFPFIRPEFAKNCQEERLLGVSLTGQMDHPELMTHEKLAILKNYVIKTCKRACKTLRIRMSAAITTGKPSGTLSQLADCASGCHARFSKFYLRRYRISGTDPLFRMMRDQGVRFTPENDQGPETLEQRRKDLVKKGRSEEETKLLIPEWDESQVMTWVCAFPVKAPEGAVTRDRVSAIEQLEWYLKIKESWAEHNQSVTIYVKDDEWLKIGSWVYDHFDDIVGVSFLPYDGGVYRQAPYEEITEKQYEEAIKLFPPIDYSKLPSYELDDNTTGAQNLACSAGGCEAA